jgi:hypothetical protein
MPLNEPRMFIVCEICGVHARHKPTQSSLTKARIPTRILVGLEMLRCHVGSAQRSTVLRFGLSIYVVKPRRR